MEDPGTDQKGLDRSESDIGFGGGVLSSEDSDNGDAVDNSAERQRKGRRPRECSTTLQAKWDEMFSRLIQFRKKHGHCLGKFALALTNSYRVLSHVLEHPSKD